MRNLLITDADNTLWDTDAVFAEAQLNLLERVEKLTVPLPSDRDRLAFVRNLDQKIAGSHPDGLRYPVSILIEELLKGLSGSHMEDGLDREAQTLQAQYYSDLKARPRLRWGVRPSLQDLSNQGVAVWVVSEASEKRVNQNLAEHDIGSFVERVVSGKKDVSLFFQLFNDARYFDFKAVVGDQLDRDIVPAKKVGFFTIHLPGSFAPAWIDPSESRFADVVVGSYRNVADIILVPDNLKQVANSG